MSFGPESLRGARPGQPPGQVDYRLVRKHTIDEFRRGRLSRLDICDAQPELLRAARNCGRAARSACPICDEDQLVMVSFVFGSRLPAHGRCVSSAREMAKLSRRADPAHCYVVEVCPGCSWNHLLQTFPIGGRARA
jgi:hypothetical protein